MLTMEQNLAIYCKTIGLKTVLKALIERESLAKVLATASEVCEEKALELSAEHKDLAEKWARTGKAVLEVAKEI